MKTIRVLITGGTGALAREIITQAAGQNVRLRLTSRRPPSGAQASSVEWTHSDLATGLGLPDALSDVDAIIHTASDFRRSQLVDVEGTGHLVAAARHAGIRHLVYISIVGIDEIPYPYYEHKLAAERLIASGRVPYSILRATQFHSLVDARLRTAARVPLVMPLPVGHQFQTVDTREVAAMLLDVAMKEPGQRLPDLGGPEVMRLGDMARVWRDVRSVHKPVLPVRFMGRVASAFRAGKNTAPGGVRGGTTWREWLDERQLRFTQSMS